MTPGVEHGMEPTPGPWILDYSEPHEIAILGAKGYEGIPQGEPGHEDDRRVIAVVTAPEGGSEADQDEANARYMAAAWSLVEAAVMARDYIRAEDEASYGAEGDVLKELDAALEQALGRA